MVTPVRSRNGNPLRNGCWEPKTQRHGEESENPFVYKTQTVSARLFAIYSPMSNYEKRMKTTFIAATHVVNFGTYLQELQPGFKAENLSTSRKSISGGRQQDQN